MKLNKRIKSPVPVWIAKIGYIVLSVLFFAIGVFLIVKPTCSALVITKICGILLVLFGAVKIVGYLSKDLYRLAFQFDLELGIILIIVGLKLFIKPENALVFMCIVMGVLLVIDGLFKFRISKQSREFGIKNWWLTFAFAILAVLTGAILIFSPGFSMSVMSVIMGIAFCVTGAMQAVVVITTVKVIRNQIVDSDYEVIYEE